MIEGAALAEWLLVARTDEAAPVGLRADVRASVDALLSEWRALPEARRNETLRRVASRLRPPIDVARAEARLPARALALLASEVPLDDGERWSRGAPSPRPDFRPDPGLVRHLRTLVAAEPAEEEPPWPD